MTPRDFSIWLKGFMAACNDFTATPAQWDKIKEELGQVQDPNDDDQGLDVEIDDWYPDPSNLNVPPPSTTVPGLFHTGTSITNYPPNTSITYTTKQLLND